MAANNPTPAERAKAFLEGILDKVPEAHRESVRAGLIDNADTAALIGSAVLRQDEFSRGKDALAQERTRLDQRQTELDDWFATNEPVVTRAKSIIEAGGADPALDPATGEPMAAATDLTKLKSEIEIRAQELAQGLIVQSERNAIPFVAELNDISMQHLHKFGEVLDTRSLTQDPRVYDGKHGLRGTYDAIHGQRWRDADTAARTAELAAAKAAGVAEATEAMRVAAAANPAANPMYPGQAPAASPMSEALAAVGKVGEDGKTAPRDFRNRVDERAAGMEYQTLVHSGAGAGG